MKSFILSLDLGTTSIRAVLFDKQSNVCAMEQKEFTQYFPKAGWVEQDAEEIWQTLQTIIARLLVNQKIDFEHIEAIGITNQRETTVLWNKHTGLPIYRAIVWQSTQTNDLCEAFIEQGYEALIKQKTGLPINSYFSATKIRWILDHVEGAQEQAEAGEILFGTVDSWILWRLSEGVHATDYSNASRTMLYNIFTLTWDEQLLSLFRIPSIMLPEVKNSSGYFATTTKKQFFNYEIPIMAIAGDQQASLFGHGCYETGIVKNTYGTGCFMLMNTKEQAILSQQGLLTTIAWGIEDKVEYAMEGSIFVAGSAVQWLRDSLQMLHTASESEAYATALANNQGVYMVPAFVGLGSPYWDSDAKGAVFGLTRGSGKAALIRATLESICYQTRDILEIMTKECKCDLKRLRVDGRAVENRFLMQFQADILGVEIDVAQINETTALGIAYLAGLGSGFWKDKAEILQYCHSQQQYKPQMEQQTKERYYRNWQKAVAATRVFKPEREE